jgi:LysR family carnitine catabolism transcriptional activator
MTITPRQLKIFVSLAKSLNFSRTAEQFFITQPSLSKAIKDLEEELGVQLFQRSTRSVRLTPSGERLTSLAHRMVGEFDNGIQHLRSLVHLESHHLAIASIPSLAHSLIPDVCLSLEKAFPAPRFTIYDGTNTSTIQRLMDYQVDLALASATPNEDEIEFEELMRDRFVLLAPRDCDALTTRPIMMQDLVDLPLICGSSASTATEYVSAAFLQRGLVFQPKFTFEQVAIAAGFVRKGLGIVIQPYLGLTPLLDFQRFQLFEIEDGPVRPVGVVRRRGHQLSEIAARAIEEARNVSRSLVDRLPRWIEPPVGGPLTRSRRS